MSTAVTRLDGRPFVPPTGRSILTGVTRTLIDVADPKPEDFDMRDIALSLAHQERFAGSNPLHPTIAQHSLAVEHIAGMLVPDQMSGNVGQDIMALRRAALMHDAGELVVSDISSIVKQELRPLLRGAAARNSVLTHAASRFDRLERLARDAIEARFNCAPGEWAGVVHEADQLALAFEMNGWWEEAQPPVWVQDDLYIHNCYRLPDGGEWAFARRADVLGMR